MTKEQLPSKKRKSDVSKPRKPRKRKKPTAKPQLPTQFEGPDTAFAIRDVDLLETGPVRKNLVELAIHDWLRKQDSLNKRIGFNTMKHSVQLVDVKREKFTDWQDHNDYTVLLRLQKDGINANTKQVSQAIDAYAKLYHRFDPILYQFKKLKWDGTPRLNMLLPKYFKCEDSEYARIIGPMFLISSVARQFEPGCQVDHMLILEGRQGLYKTRGLEALFGKEYTNDRLQSFKGVDADISVRGFLVVNIDELNTFKGSKIAAMKSFITLREQTYVPKYANRSVKEPRRCVFVGTTNESLYLFDDENRRFWPIEVREKIDTDAIERDKDQLWAEAIHRYHAGEAWWPSDEQVPMIVREQQKRQPEDPMIEQLNEIVWLQPSTTVNEICHTLYGSASSADKGKAMIIGRKLSEMGFERTRHHGSLQKRVRPDLSSLPEGQKLAIAYAIDQCRIRNYKFEKVLKSEQYNSAQFIDKHYNADDPTEIDADIHALYSEYKFKVRDQSPKK